MFQVHVTTFNRRGNIDWHEVYAVFIRQQENLFVFLGEIRVEGRPLSEEERIDGFCAIISNEDWTEEWDSQPFAIENDGKWEYAVVPPVGILKQ